MDTLVTVDLDNHSLKECLSMLTDAYAVNFSYINDEIPLQKQLHGTALKIPLHIVLDTVCKQVAIRYFIVGTQIVLKKTEEKLIPSEPDSSITKPIIATQSEIREDSVHTTAGITTGDEYQMNKKYAKYFFSVFGKRSVPDSMIVVSSNGDTIAGKPETKKYRYVNRKYTYSDWSVGFYAGPGTSYRSLTGEAQFVAERNSEEKSMRIYTIGGQITYSLKSRHVSFRSGLNYTVFGEKGSYTEIVNVPPSSQSSPRPGMQRIIQQSYKNQYQYILLPVLVGYTYVINSSIGLSMYTGFSLAFMLHTKSSYQETGNGNYPSVGMYRNPFLHTYNNVSLVWPVQAEVAYQVTARVHLFVLPAFNYFLTSIYTKNAYSKEKPYAFTVSAGVKYFFKWK